MRGDGERRATWCLDSCRLELVSFFLNSHNIHLVEIYTWSLLAGNNTNIFCGAWKLGRYRFGSLYFSSIISIER
jgi:hypothetical protein